MILAGDIGGTHARFGAYVDGQRIALAEWKTSEYETGAALLAAALDALPPRPVEACCLAVAGPVLGGQARLTNAEMVFSRQALADATGTERVALINDLVAIGSAVGGLPDDCFERLGGTPATGANGVVAAGTGLGMGIVVDGVCLPSEGGHARVAPVGAFERELLAVTEAEVDYSGGVVAWEHYLSGRGVEALHRAVAAVWGAAVKPLAAEEITRRGLDMSDPVCHTTLETWVGMLATAAGGLAVTALTLGGIYLAGSVPLALADLLRTPLFRRRFADAAWEADFLAQLPIYLVPDPLAGLDGARLLAERTQARQTPS